MLFWMFARTLPPPKEEPGLVGQAAIRNASLLFCTSKSYRKEESLEQEQKMDASLLDQESTHLLYWEHTLVHVVPCEAVPRAEGQRR